MCRTVNALYHCINLLKVTWPIFMGRVRSKLFMTFRVLLITFGDISNRFCGISLPFICWKSRELKKKRPLGAGELNDHGGFWKPDSPARDIRQLTRHWSLCDLQFGLCASLKTQKKGTQKSYMSRMCAAPPCNKVRGLADVIDHAKILCRSV